MLNIRHRFFALLVLAIAPHASAYPGFVGYGYTSCATCHYNPQGNGPLTDYGRALFAQEIASRALIPASVSDETLAENSTFIPGVGAESRFKPSLKYRGLWFQVSPRPPSGATKWVNMQQDLNLVVHLDSAAQHVASATVGLLGEKRVFYKNGNDDSLWFPRDYFFRSFVSNFSFTLGLVDKVFGIRTADHTAYNRSRLGLGQNDQVHGIVTQWTNAKWEIAGHLFVGNYHRIEEDRQKGFSLLVENEIAEKHRLGVSYIDFATSFVKSRRFAIHDRLGLQKFHGSSLMFEVGLKQDESLTAGSTETSGYGLIEGMFNLARGYNILTTVEGYQTKLSADGVRATRWSFGLLTFPWQRLEARLGIVQTKTFSPVEANADTWAVQAQVHASL